MCGHNYLKGSKYEIDLFDFKWYIDFYDIIHVADLNHLSNVEWLFVLFHWHVGVHFHISLTVSLHGWVIHGDLKSHLIFIIYGRIDGLVWDPSIVRADACTPVAHDEAFEMIQQIQLVLQELWHVDRDITQFFIWDPGGDIFQCVWLSSGDCLGSSNFKRGGL